MSNRGCNGYLSIFNAVNDAIFIHDIETGNVIDANLKACEMYGYTVDELKGPMDIISCEPPPYSKDDALQKIRLASSEGPQIFEWRARGKNGRSFWVEVNLKRAAVGGTDKVISIVCDINERKLAEDRYRHLADSLPEVIYEIDLKGNLLYANRNALNFFGATQEDFDKGIVVFDYIVPEDRLRVRENMIKIINGSYLGGQEYTARRKDGSRFPITIHSNAMIEDGRPVGFRGIIIDISERKKLEEQLKTLSLHDSLTGLYNRAYFEREMKQLSKQFCLVVCDVDGLKLVNDTLGHDIGDKLLITAASLLKSTLREKDIVARIGGDEFALILPGHDPDAAKAVCARLQKTVAAYNDSNPNLPLSISTGFSCGSNTNIIDAFKEADNNMYREKLHRSKSTRSAIVHTLMIAFEERDYLTKGHADRIQDLVVKIGGNLGMNERNLSDLRLFAKFHDIGKSVVPDRILFKKNSLTEEEKEVMRCHCEIGHRIAQSAPDLVLISDWILKHHEWWNGEGYPLGLRGEQIPIECRILAIADAFDAMTSNRPYRAAMSIEVAKKELVKYAGIQFDPALVFETIDLFT